MQVEVPVSLYDTTKPEIPFAVVGRRIIVEPDQAATQTAGGILIPEVAKGKVTRGVLLGAGIAAMDVLRDMGIKLGDKVLWAQYAGNYWEWPKPNATSSLDVRKARILNVDDILGGEELAQRFHDKDITVEWDAKTNMHYLVERK